MQSLAEFLGVADPQAPKDSQAPALVAPSPRMSVKDFARLVLSSQQYRDSLFRRILMDELPPQIEQMLYFYAHGKPVEHLEVKDTTTRLEDLTAEQLEARALYLSTIAKQLRTSEDEATPDGDRTPESVH